MTAYYNEHDAFAAAWLRELMKEGCIAPGHVDERSIEEVQASDLRGFRQCHFFAGIAVWSYALRAAGWADDRECWTGSCPCQPFSASGKREGFNDERHLWPAWFRLIAACQPAVIFGEQVASSNVIGKTMQTVWTDEISRRLSEARQRRFAWFLPGVRERVDANSEAVEIGEQEEVHGQAPRDASRILTGSRCETPSSGKGPSFRFGVESNPATDRGGDVRGDGTAIRPDTTESLECTVAGSNHPIGRIHPAEHAGGVVRLKHDGEQLGRGTDRQDCRSDTGETVAECVERLISETRREAQEENAEAWFDLVRSDLERTHYTVGACITAACGFGSPHIRQRLYFVADAERGAAERHGRQMGATPRRMQGQAYQRERIRLDAGDGIATGELGQPSIAGLERHAGHGGNGHESRRHGTQPLGSATAASADGDVGHAEWRGCGISGDAAQPERSGYADGPKFTNGFWRDAIWLPCRDGKWRPTKPGLFPLATGVANRVGTLRGAGNALCAETAIAFIEAYMSTVLVAKEHAANG